MEQQRLQTATHKNVPTKGIAKCSCSLVDFEFVHRPEMPRILLLKCCSGNCSLADASEESYHQRRSSSHATCIMSNYVQKNKFGLQICRHSIHPQWCTARARGSVVHFPSSHVSNQINGLHKTCSYSPSARNHDMTLESYHYSTWKCCFTRTRSFIKTCLRWSILYNSEICVESRCTTGKLKWLQKSWVDKGKYCIYVGMSPKGQSDHQRIMEKE